MIATPVSDHILRHAIELKCSGCYGAMSIANALGGSQTEDWKIARAHKLVDLIAEARRRQLDMATWKTAVDDAILCDSEPAREAFDKIRRLEQQGAFLSDDGWRCDDGTVPLGTTVDVALEAVFG
jgi:hypothetical protein